jgi:hypothetical protein
VSEPEPVVVSTEGADTARAASSQVGWLGLASLRDYLTPIADLEREPSPDVDVEAVAAGLAEHGQLRAVLVDEARRVVGNGFLVDAAVSLGWTHVAARRFAEEPTPQLSLVDEVERAAPDEFALMKALSPAERLARTEEEEIADLNETSADPNARWVGLPAFVRVGSEWKLVVSCETEEARDALLDVLGIGTIHKGTRGTLSAWWPNRAKKDLASLRFEASPDGGVPF